MASRLAAVHGHQHLDWVLLLDPVADEQQACWTQLARTLQRPDQGRGPIALGQQLRSSGLSVHVLRERGQPMALQAGHQLWWVLPRPQALWALQRDWAPGEQLRPTAAWLGFQPTAPQRRWLRRRISGDIRWAGDDVRVVRRRQLQNAAL